jgi:hypothetical protein
MDIVHMFQDIQVAEDEIGMGDQADMTVDISQTLQQSPGDLVLLFSRLIRVSQRREIDLFPGPSACVLLHRVQNIFPDFNDLSPSIAGIGCLGRDLGRTVGTAVLTSLVGIDHGVWLPLEKGSGKGRDT